jgi:hypothetical protein
VNTDYFGNLSKIEAQPVALRGWGYDEHLMFLDKWGTQWVRWISGQQQSDIQNIDPLLLNHWLLMDAHTYTPLELTLKAWGSYANDLIGSHPMEVYENYIARMTNNNAELQIAFEQTAYNTVLASNPLVNAESGPDLIFEKSTPDSVAATSGAEPDDTELEPDLLAEEEEVFSAQSVGTSRLRSSRLLIPRARNTFGFRNPAILAYLAAGNIRNGPATTLAQKPDWILKNLTFRFLSFYQDTSQYIIKDDSGTKDPLQSDLTALAKSLRYIPSNTKRLSTVLESIIYTIQQEHIPLGVRARLFTALVTLNNANIESLMKHFRGSSKPSVRQLAVLGTGVLRNQQAFSELTFSLEDSPTIAKAACLALVQIGSQEALEAVIHILLEASEDLRRAAAEALANHPDEGYPVLIDGTKIEDLLVRRAVVFGLRRTRSEWATEKLREVQIEEGQWVVRDAAEEALSSLKEQDPGLPSPLPDLVNLPWLISYAGDYGQGIGTADAARDMLISAFKMGSPVQKIAALEQLKLRADTGVFPEIYDLLFGSDFELSEIALNAVWHLKKYGIEVPSPTRFGFN